MSVRRCRCCGTSPSCIGSNGRRSLGLTHDQRGHWRHAKAKPVLKRLQRKFREAGRESAPPSGNLREAVTYANNRWPILVRYAKVGFGHMCIDQNPIERCFRPEKWDCATTCSSVTGRRLALRGDL